MQTEAYKEIRKWKQLELAFIHKCLKGQEQKDALESFKKTTWHIIEDTNYVRNETRQEIRS